MTSAYPLQWPEHVARSRSREKGQFRTTLPGAIRNVTDSLRLFGRDSGKSVSGLVFSSNVTLGSERPDDPGVAVWFVWDGLQICIPVDRYASVAANLQAIHHIVEARRVELRHGTLALVRATFTGFAALPSPDRESWRDILRVPPGPVTLDAVNKAFREAAKRAHPDRSGGSHLEMTRVAQARAAALAEIERNAAKGAGNDDG